MAATNVNNEAILHIAHFGVCTYRIIISSTELLYHPVNIMHATADREPNEAEMLGHNDASDGPRALWKRRHLLITANRCGVTASFSKTYSKVEHTQFIEIRRRSTTEKAETSDR